MDYIRPCLKKKQTNKKSKNNVCFLILGPDTHFQYYKCIVFTYARRHSLASKSHDVAGSYVYGIAGELYRGCFSIFQFGDFPQL